MSAALSPTAPRTTHPTPMEVLRTAAAVIQLRGRYQPNGRSDEAEPPTARVVRHYLTSRQMRSIYGIPRTRIDAAYAAESDTAAGAYHWCAAPSETTDYRTKLAAAVADHSVTEQNLPLVCSAAAAYRAERERTIRRAMRREEAGRSTHQATKGERIAHLPVTVTAVIKLTPRKFGYTEQPRHLIKLRDAGANVYMWQASTLNLPARDTPILISGTVSKHDHYTDRTGGHRTAQTHLTRCRWTLAQPPTDA